jgi:hypothetical protein
MVSSLLGLKLGRSGKQWCKRTQKQIYTNSYEGNAQNSKREQRKTYFLKRDYVKESFSKEVKFAII